MSRHLFKGFQKILSNSVINDIAVSTKFKNRNSGKISTMDFLWLNSFSDNLVASNTLEELTASLATDKCILVSSQAIDKRYNDSAVDFLKEIFLNILEKTNNSSINNNFKSIFSSILLMDSTEIKLPAKLANDYKGFNVFNPSVAKINLLMELLNYNIKNIEIRKGVENEHNFSKYVYPHLKENTLVLKDLGYFKHSDFIEISNRKAFFVSRLRNGARLYSLNPNPSFNKDGSIKNKSKYLVTSVSELVKSMEINEVKEFDFFIGNEKISYRIILVKLPEGQVKKRLKKVEKREKRNNKEAKLTKESIEVSAFITNIPDIEKEEIPKLYKLRWQIELMFKMLKSDFSIDLIKNVKKSRIECQIYGILIRLIILFYLTKEIKNGYSDEESIRRMVKKAQKFLKNLVNNIDNEEQFVRLIEILEKIIKKVNKKAPNHQSQKPL